MAYEVVEFKSLLSIRPAEPLSTSQLSRIHPDSLHEQPVGTFDPASVLQDMIDLEGETIMTIDMGGDKVTAIPHTLHDGKLIPETSNYRFVQGDKGIGYLEFLEQISLEAIENNMQVAISFAGPTEESRPIGGPNVPVFLDELRATYGGDFANLFPTLLKMSNDARAGLMTGAVEAARWGFPARNVIYIINGSGFGGALIVDGSVIAAEPGHVEVEPSFNPYYQEKPCGMFGASFVCVEGVAGGKAGIEDIYHQQTGMRLSGREISKLYQNGDELALNLYDNSALLTAHMVAGMAASHELLVHDNDTVIVFHGGVFQVPGYGDRVMQILEKHYGYKPGALYTKDFSFYACAEGAAIAAIAG